MKPSELNSLFWTRVVAIACVNYVIESWKCNSLMFANASEDNGELILIFVGPPNENLDLTGKKHLNIAIITSSDNLLKIASHFLK